MKDKLVLVTLNTGEVLLGEKVDVLTGELVLKNILQMMRTPQGITFIEYMPIVEEDDFPFPLDSLRHQPMTPKQEIVDMWNQRFGAGIQIASTVPGSQIQA